MAIEDGYVLAEHAAAHRGRDGTVAWDMALKAYEAVRAGHCRRVLLTSRAWGELWHVGGAKRERRNEILRARDTYDYGFVDWLYERTALTPDQEPEMFTPVPLDPAHLDTIV
jgi:salicylate hydroxylase